MFSISVERTYFAVLPFDPDYLIPRHVNAYRLLTVALLKRFHLQHQCPTNNEHLAVNHLSVLSSINLHIYSFR